MCDLQSHVKSSCYITLKGTECFFYKRIQFGRLLKILIRDNNIIEKFHRYCERRKTFILLVFQNVFA